MFIEIQTYNCSVDIFIFSDLSWNRLSHIDAGTPEGISDKLTTL